MDHEKYYETRGISFEEANAKALEIVQMMDGMATGVAIHILHRAEFWLKAMTTVDCSTVEFQSAVAVYPSVAAKSP